jgi:radical SAM protein (TIGR01212 family)
VTEARKIGPKPAARLPTTIGNSPQRALPCVFTGFLLTIFLVSGMNFPVSLQIRWRGKRFNSYNRVLKDIFCARVYKIGLRMDFTCPNRDGKVAVGGCIYCNNASHTPEDYRPRVGVTEQLHQGAAALKRRHRADRYIAYFQSYTNTYDSVAMLENLYREALAFPGVVGLAIATRPDCVGEDVLDLVQDLSRRTYFWLELGLESMHNRTLQWVNRGHGLREFIDAVERAKRRQLRTCAHVILGFPGESRDDMLETTDLLNGLGIDGVKLHNLHVIKTLSWKNILAGGFALEPAGIRFPCRRFSGKIESGNDRAPAHRRDLPRDYGRAGLVG